MAPLVSFFADWSLSQKQSNATPASLCPRVTTSLVRIHTWQPIKGQLLCKVPTDPQKERHIITNRSHFLSHFSYRSKSQNPEKVQEHSNPNRFSRIKIQQLQWSLHRFSEIPYRTFIIESIFLCNSSANSPPKGSKLKRDHRGRVWEEEGKDSRIPNQFRRKRRGLRFRSQIQAKKSTKQNQIQGFRRFRLKIPRLNTGNTQTQSHTVKKPSQVRKQRESMEDSNCLVRKP